MIRYPFRRLVTQSQYPLRAVHCAIVGNIEISSSSTRSTFPSVDPATDEPIGEVVNCSKAEAEDAIAAAHHCFTSFKCSSVTERGRLLTMWADAIQKNAHTIAELVTREMGKPKMEALGEVTYATSFLYHYAGQVTTATTGNLLNRGQPHWRPVTLRQPVGVVATITPWNFPVAMVTRKVGAAIAAGCSVINSPSEDTPLTSLYLAKLAVDVGFPTGLFNVVPSSRDKKQEIGEALCGSTDISALSFTGSTAVGKLLYRQCSDTIKRVHLELGGNAPFIVFPSADLDRAVKGAMVAKFRNCGQACNAANRFFVHSSVYSEFIERLAKEVSTLNQGCGLSEDVTLGPLVNKRAYDKVSTIVDNVRAQSETITHTSSPNRLSPYYDPTLLSFGDKTQVSIFKEEIFGPVASIWKFDEEEEVVKLANSSRYGLQAYIFTNDLKQSWRVSEELEFGMIAVNEGAISSPNNPFGGWKESGIGREAGPGGIDEFTEEKLMCFGL